MKKIYLALLGFFLFTGMAQAAPVEIHTQDGRTLKFNVEVAKDDKTRGMGLMWVDKLPEDGGMLFVFPKRRFATFWMKNTPLSLDIMFIDEKGVITRIYENAEPYSQEPITSKGPALYVLEVLAGTVKKLNISKGDKVISKEMSNGLETQ